ncbi:MAG: 16S rRNA processing protein RimM [Myxococcales bacterium]|nr:16S rRNA processing protein RimM [Myxococcales bacterium]
MSRSLLEIGSVCRPHGLRGELRVKLHDPGSDALDAIEHIWTEKDSEAPQMWRLKSFRGEANGFFVLTVDGISDRTAAEALTRQKLLAARDELPALESDEFYLVDLIGCEVQTVSGERVGIISEILNFGAQPQLSIARDERESALVPIVTNIFISYDSERRLVVVDPPVGLLDIDLK